MPEGLILVLLFALCLAAGGAIGFGLGRRRDQLTEARLTEAEARKKAILDAAVDGIITIDERGRIQSFNRAAELIFGYMEAEVLNHNVSMLMPEPHRSAHDTYLRNYLWTGQAKIIGIGREVEGLRRNGTTFPMDLAVGEARSDGRRVFAGIVRDITARKRTEERLRESEARTRAILEAMVDAVVTIDEGGIIRSTNPACERTFGYRGVEMVGHNVSMLMPEPYRSAHDNYLRNYLRTGEARVIGIGREVQGLRRDGTVFPMELTVGEGMLGGGRIFAGVVRDITDRKAVEEKLRAAKAAAEQAKESAERAAIAKTKFLAAASHDLRQPVQALFFFTSVLSHKLRGHSAKPVLEDLQRSLDGLNILLDSLLDVSKLDAGLVTPKETDFSVGAVLERVASDFAPAARDKGVELRMVPCSATIRSDPALLTRIIQNLVSNAVRYTRSGRILVGCRRRPQGLEIQVLDTGMGIPPERTAEIFEEFTQLGNPERDRNQGLGLGLSIVDRLARLMRHQVRVHSLPGRGSAFSVTVPVVRQGARASAPSLRRRRSSEPGKGLVVLIDDEPIVLKGLTMVLQSWGYEVIAAASEAEALDKLQSLTNPPAIILADYRLREGRTGTEAVEHIRDLFHQAIPSVIITGDTAPERLKEAEASGLSILHKPIQPPALRQVLRDFLETTNPGSSIH